MSDRAINLIVICGPTASGKTGLGVSLAQTMSIEIISADSRQVYRGMDIGTGKDLSEYHTPRGDVPYHLIDIADPSEIYTLPHYQSDCYAAIRDIRQRGLMPVMIGGTGLYIEAVLRTYEIPNVPENPELRKRLIKIPKEELLDRLRASDAHLFHSTDISSKKRIVRALEIAEHAKTGTVERGGAEPPDMEPLICCVTWPRKELMDRINTRLKKRLENGMVEEVRKLLEQGISMERFAYFGLEYKHVSRYIDGKVSYSSMAEMLARDIHRFAKRQMTYFRGMERRGLSIHWTTGNNREQVLELIKKQDAYN